MDKRFIIDAINYNVQGIDSVYNLDDLPYPLIDATGKEFVAWVCYFQQLHGLKADGKLGARTLDLIRVRQGIDDDFKIIDRPALTTNPPERAFSNCIIIDGKRVKIPQIMINRGFTASNYIDDDEVHFSHRKRIRKIKWFVLHETVGNTASGCVRSLKKKGYGVQLVQDEMGHIACHGDLVRDRMIHANQLNNYSFGCEQINPYNPLFASNKAFSSFVNAKWWTWIPSIKQNGVSKLLKRKNLTSVPKKYVLLTERQVESMLLFAPWVCDQVGIPFNFPTESLSRKKRKISAKFPTSRGIVAHRDFSNHSDGRYMLERLIERKRVL